MIDDSNCKQNGAERVFPCISHVYIKMRRNAIVHVKMFYNTNLFSTKEILTHMLARRK